ncbi:MAG: efflux RND transporter periplasmic adaptor subunit [Elusimicrobiales bacterium]
MRLYLTIPAIAALALCGCHDGEKRALEKLEKDRFLVKTEKAAVRDIDEEILLTGSVKAMDEATLFPRVSGKLLKNLVIEGDPVTKDQTVALIERDEVGARFEPAPVPSTLTGVVGRVYQDVGANVTLATPIALVVDQSRVRIKVDLPERYSGVVRLGQSALAEVEAFPDKTFAAKVYKISPVIDPVNRSALVELLADNSQGQLKSGMFAKVRLIAGRAAGAVSVPVSALQQDKKGDYVFVPAGSVAARRYVAAGTRNVEYAQIKSGLRPGQEVITFGLYGLKDGSKIEMAH